jgi:hypothetical protein
MQVGNYTALTNNQGGYTWLSNNAFYDTAWKYLTTNRALYYAQNTSDGGHNWYNAPSGTAGNAITFTQAMTLNASGNLGIGTTSPTAKLSIGGSDAPKLNLLVASGGERAFIDYTEATSLMRIDSDAAMAFNTNNTERMRLDSFGNLGLGVTPSAWAGVTALQMAGSGAIGFNNQYGEIDSNAYYNAGYKYIGTGLAAKYDQAAGLHRWFNAPSGTAGNAITFTQAMTLDASGNLLVGTTSANVNGGVLQLKSGITFPATQVASTDVNTLDDYEEGTWTPTVNFVTNGDLAVVYSNQAARYTKVGNAVHFSVRVTTTTFTHTTASGAFRITGLPFTPSASQPFVSPSGYITRYTKAGYTQIVFQIASSDSNIYSLLIGSGVAPFSLDPTCLPTAVNFDVVVSGTYFV